MKKLISKFSDKLLSKQQLKAVKGGSTPYCFCVGSGIFVACPWGYTHGSQVPSGVGDCP
ncbi:hypothetical protein [Ulvibacterium marinum]|uniref:hypothetical protein n=1 Tax=Ulvibacterium marinum TaxID=2419782 RepID=UPI002494D9F0|nr:hypothetical protein [Ulvibacterium marinum]